MKIYNSLSKKIEEFKPINPHKVGMYTCGPTVYSYPTIGNYRTYVTSDLLLRTLKSLGYKVEYVMNLTDVGHLTGDNSGDADTGEDRLEKAAKKEGKNAWDIAKFYSEDFRESFAKLNMIMPDHLVAATDHIAEQIQLVKKLGEKGLTYKIDDGIYFDTVTYEKQTGEKYGELSTLDQIKEGARVEPNREKKNPRDFALWKFSPKEAKRQMEWKSPWGTGFPGWHLECSAMSMKYLGEQFDIHAGGEDLRSTHHPNEIAQSEGATGKIPFVKYWVHGAFLLVNGGRMGKSLGNAYTIHDVEKKGFSPLDLRYFYLTGNYRKQINFTWEALIAAQNALDKLRNLINNWNFRIPFEGNETSESYLNSHPDSVKKIKDWNQSFTERIIDDIDMPGALAVVWQMTKDHSLPESEKLILLEKWDEVLGLNLSQPFNNSTIKPLTPEIEALLKKRKELRLLKKFKEADEVRDEIIKLGYTVSDDAAS